MTDKEKLLNVLDDIGINRNIYTGTEFDAIILINENHDYENR